LNTPGASAPDLRIKAPTRGLAFARGSNFGSRSLAGSLLSGLAVLGMVGAISLVVRQAVRQGEAGRRAMAMQAEADWRCRALKGRVQRERCQALVREHKPWDTAGVQALVVQARSDAARP
jgi:hypothetical protein